MATKWNHHYGIILLQPTHITRAVGSIGVVTVDFNPRPDDPNNKQRAVGSGHIFNIKLIYNINPTNSLYKTT
jgi:hypothetical protein